MEREYDKTLDLSRGQGTGMQSFERENGKHWSNVISLRWEYLQLSRNFSCLWPLCPCHRLRAPECTNELEGAVPATACTKLCFWYAGGSKAQVFWPCSYSSPSCKAHSCGCFTSAHVGMGLCITALPLQATGTMMHIPHWLPNVWNS